MKHFLHTCREPPTSFGSAVLVGICLVDYRLISEVLHYRVITR